MLQLRLAEAHAWVGDALLDAGESSRGRVHLGRSLMHQPWQPRTLKLLSLAAVPDAVRQPLRRLVRAMKLKIERKVGGTVATEAS